MKNGQPHWATGRSVGFWWGTIELLLLFAFLLLSLRIAFLADLAGRFGVNAALVLALLAFRLGLVAATFPGKRRGRDEGAGKHTNNEHLD